MFARRIHTKIITKRFNSTKSRLYFASMGAQEKPMPARIVQSWNEIQLQLHVPNQYIPVKKMLGVPRLRDIAKDIKLGETHTWSSILKITTDGLSANEYMYLSDELMQLDDNTPLYKVAAGSAYSSWYHSDFYFPNLLFSIPPPVWNDFIAKLQHQNVVNSLNLAEHRHLCVAYPYASDKDARINDYRSDAIGKYHFLASIIVNATCSDEYLKH